MKVRLIQTVEGVTIRSEFADTLDAIVAMKVRGYEVVGLNSNPSQRAELQGKPKFRGVNGPMWDGDAIRYEAAPC